MAGVEIDRGSLLKIARQYGEQGKPLPAEMAADPELVNAYDLAAGRTPAKPATKPPVKKTPPPARKPSTPAPTPAQASSSPSRSSSSSSPGFLSRAFSPTAAADKAGVTGVAQKVAGAGDGGGLLLALVIYPIALATLKYGASGPGIWFRAKWLNQATSAPASNANVTLPASVKNHATAIKGASGPGQNHARSD